MYDEAFAGCVHVKTPAVAPHSRHVFHQYTLQLAEGTDRDALIAHLNSKGIPAMIYYPVPLRKQKAYDTHDYDDSAYPEYGFSGTERPVPAYAYRTGQGAGGLHFRCGKGVFL